MKISVITPSIRPDGLKTTFETLSKQTMPRGDWEWLPRLSIPGEKPDLCYQVNRALAESRGELIVFLQDHIEISPEGLQRAWDVYEKDKENCYTFTVGKVKKRGDAVEWDWRHYWKHKDDISFERWEIDYGMAPAKALKDVGFDECYDGGFGWENVDTAYILSRRGWGFKVDSENAGIALDHDVHEPHPFRKNTNQKLWLVRKEVIDMMYGGGESWANGN